MSNLRKELSELREYFENTKLPTGDIIINAHITVSDVPQFIKAEINRIENYKGSEVKFDREFKLIRQLRAVLETTNSY